MDNNSILKKFKLLILLLILILLIIIEFIINLLDFKHHKGNNLFKKLKLTSIFVKMMIFKLEIAKKLINFNKIKVNLKLEWLGLYGYGIN